MAVLVSLRIESTIFNLYIKHLQDTLNTFDLIQMRVNYLDHVNITMNVDLKTT